MNKLFTKIAALALGMTMATGVGVAVASSSKEASPAEAAASYAFSGDTVTFANQGLSDATQYSGDFTNAASDNTFKVNFTGGGNDGKYYNTGTGIRTYGGGSVNVTALNGGTLTEVVFTFSGSSYAAPTNNITGYTLNGATGTWTGSASTISLTRDSGSGNWRLQKVKATVSSGSTKKATTTTVSAVSTSLGVGDQTTLSATVSYDGGTITSPTVTYTSGDTSIATVSGSTVTAVGVGTVEITGSYAGDDTYAASSDKVEITVSAKTVEGAGTVYFGSGSDTGRINVNTASVSGTDTIGNEWSVTTVGTSSFSPNAGYAQIGSKDSPATSITFTQNFTSTFYVTSFEAKFGGNNSTAGDITAKVGSTTIATGSLNGASDVIVSKNSTVTSGSSLVVTVTNISRGVKAYYISYTLSSSAAVTYTVTYNGNGNTGGTVPTDSSSPYNSGAEVTVLGNTGGLVKSSYVFNGWNTAADGTGTARAAGSKFNISENTTLYAQWIQTLDAITSISGTVTASISRAGTYDWNFNNISVTGTFSGVSDQDVKNYVDLSSTTQIPSSTGPVTVSVTATKKSTISGSATSLTNANISGEVGVATLTYTFTMSYSDLTKTSYADEDNAVKTSTATCENHESIDISWRTSNVQKNNSSGVYSMQFRGSPVGYLYNLTEIPGTITGISYNDSVLQGSFTNYYGNSEHPTESTTVGGKYFSVVSTTGTDKVQSITVTFEVSDKPSVQLVAQDMILDVADGAATPTVTDGTSAITGYSMTSEDSYIASITNNGKVQPVGYGKVTINVTKAEDSGHIYLATTFTVTVGDSSKEVSEMNFVEAAGGSATADDGVVWTITANASENEFSEVYGINYGTNNSKVSSLTLTTPADEERIIKNVVVEAISATDGSTITVTVGETSFTCSKSNSLTGSVTTFNFSGNTSGAITITMSGTASSKYGVKSIHVLYVGDEAESFASTFLGAFSCDSSGVNKPSFNLQPDGETRWTWALLATEYNGLDSEAKAKFAVGATGVSATITQCVNRYDYVVGKYYKTGLDTSFTDFMNRDPSPVGSSRAILNSVIGESGNTVAIIVIISVVSVSAVGGYFFIRKRKEN